MADLDIARSVRFVSLDTHPANNALVVTYEILVVVTDLQRGHELTRRSKRDQLQVNVSALDKLSESDLRKPGGMTTLNLRQLSEDIIKKCPILGHSEDSQALEDIQLHLLYLFNRKQAQLYQSKTGATERPPSAASGRLRSATPSQLSSARQRSARARDGRRSSLSSRGDITSSSFDVYANFCEREQRDIKGCDATPACHECEEFLQQFHQHLLEAEAARHIGQSGSSQQIDFDVILENLYGELKDKLSAMTSLRWHVRDDLKLANLNPDRLLISAMLRTLQDSDAREPVLSETILYCILRFTHFEDVHERVFNQGEPIDIMRNVVDLLDEHTKLATRTDDLKSILDRFYQLNSLLVILNNIIKLDLHIKSNKVKKKLIQQHGKQLTNALIGLLVLLARHLTRDVRTQSTLRYERLTLVLAELIKLLQSLVIFREFINLLRIKSTTLVEALVSCLDTLQLCRPGSGGSQQPQQQQSASEQEQFFVKDQLILCEIYGLEVELLKLIGNLIYDARFRLRFSRKNLLLRCVLRNLVVFLASSRRSNTLTPFDRSSALLVPFKCLYELSCQDSIKEELFKSKIIIKCLFEYLLSSTADLKTLLDSLATGETRGHKRQERPASLEDDQICLEPNQASHYILAIWVNLSAKREAPFFGGQVNKELSEPLSDYLDLITANLVSFVDRIRHMTRDAPISQHFQDAQLIIYLHTKLLRNLTQHLGFFESEPIIWASSYARWLENLALSIDRLLARVSQDSANLYVVPLAVECLATMTNLILRAGSFWYLDDEMMTTIPMLDWPPELASILRLLLAINLADAQQPDGEHDDLLLVSINFMGALGKNFEICNQLKGLASDIVEVANFVLENKSTDVEMTISCLFTLSQLTNHFVFLQELGGSLEEQQRTAFQLVDRLSALMMHADPAVLRLANVILNSLKQFEEQQSISDSVTGKRRFQCYNEKWLSAIRANRDEPAADDAAAANEEDEQKGQNQALLLSHRSPPQSDLDLLDDFNQLRTVGTEADLQSSSRMSTSSSNRSSSTTNQPTDELSASLAPARPLDQDEDELDEMEVMEERESVEDEETFSEPDLNVIDANSMIKHLTNRREFRSELLMMRK